MSIYEIIRDHPEDGSVEVYCSPEGLDQLVRGINDSQLSNAYDSEYFTRAQVTNFTYVLPDSEKLDVQLDVFSETRNRRPGEATLLVKPKGKLMMPESAGYFVNRVISVAKGLPQSQAPVPILTVVVESIGRIFRVGRWKLIKMYLHIVEKPRVNLPEIKEDPFKPDYLSSLDPSDRENIERILNQLESNLPSRTRVIAVGSSVMDVGYRPRGSYGDIDLKVFSEPDFIQILGELVYDVISRMQGFKVEKYLGSGFMSRINHLPRGYWSSDVLKVQPSNGKSIDLLISSITFDEHFARSPLPHYVLR